MLEGKTGFWNYCLLPFLTADETSSAIEEKDLPSGW